MTVYSQLRHVVVREQTLCHRTHWRLQQMLRTLQQGQRWCGVGNALSTAPGSPPRQCKVTGCGQQVDSIRVHGCILTHV